MIDLTVKGNQIRINKRNTLFDIEGLTELQIINGAKEFFKNYFGIEKNFEDKENPTLKSRNLMNCFMINYFHIENSVIKSKSNIICHSLCCNTVICLSCSNKMESDDTLN